jgi:hypothetical protein
MRVRDEAGRGDARRWLPAHAERREVVHGQLLQVVLARVLVAGRHLRILLRELCEMGVLGRRTIPGVRRPAKRQNVVWRRRLQRLGCAGGRDGRSGRCDGAL